MAISENSDNANQAAVSAENTAGGDGVFGKGLKGVVGVTDVPGGMGVFGTSEQGIGVWGQSDSNDAVVGVSYSGKVGVRGDSITEGGVGVAGNCHEGRGVQGKSGIGTGVFGTSTSGVGVRGASETNEGMHAETKSPTTAAIAAFNLNPAGTGAAIFAKKERTQGHAGFFDGNVWVSGEFGVGKDIILANADCAEDFDIVDADLIDPGTVMVVGEEGALHQSHQAYDKRVAGVISGAGDYKPGIVLDKQQSRSNRKPIALLGKVFCKVDASYAPIEVGDLLTTAPTLGHAMKATDPLKAFGAVIGKALCPLKEGLGLIPILIALQ